MALKNWKLSCPRFVITIAILSLFRCASTPKADDESKFTISKDDKSKFTLVEAASNSGSANYKFQDQEGVVEWMACSPKQTNTGTVLVFHGFDSGYEPSLFCSGWPAQFFLQKGYSVFAANRPGYGKSTGGDDLSGGKSIEAIHAAVQSAKVVAKISNVEGMWAYDTGTIAASFYAKKYGQSLTWLIFGGGVYDLEVVGKGTDNANLKSALARVKLEEGEVALERRSIAWDFAGLPKLLGIYHVKDDLFSPMTQTESFTNQLRTSEFKVFKSEINEGGHQLPWRAHLKILDQVFSQIKPAEVKK